MYLGLDVRSVRSETVDTLMFVDPLEVDPDLPGGGPLPGDPPGGDSADELSRGYSTEATLIPPSLDQANLTVQFPAFGGVAGFTASEIRRDEFEVLIRPIVDRTLEPCRRALADADLQPSQIDEVVLVGGSTRIPLVRRLVGDLFGRRPHSELNPDEVVALGAAVQADILVTGNRDMLLLDVTPLSLGIETMGGVTSKIILRNSTIPATGSEMFTSGVDNQTAVDLTIYQGERELAKDCRALGHFKLRGIPPLPAGLPRMAAVRASLRGDWPRTRARCTRCDAAARSRPAQHAHQLPAAALARRRGRGRTLGAHLQPAGARAQGVGLQTN